MLCPVCKTALTMAERQGVEIDYCAQCRGVWLDRGELDKIIERNGAATERGDSREYARQRDDRSIDERHYRDHHHARRKRSMLSDLFDF